MRKKKKDSKPKTIQDKIKTSHQKINEMINLNDLIY